MPESCRCVERTAKDLAQRHTSVGQYDGWGAETVLMDPPMPIIDDFTAMDMTVPSIPTFDVPTLDAPIQESWFPATDVSAIPVAETSWFNEIPWGSIGSGAAALLKALAPVAAPITQAIIGTPTPTPGTMVRSPSGALVRQPPPTGYGYTATGQLAPIPQGATVNPTTGMIEQPTSWTPLLLIGGGLAAVMLLGRGKRR